MTRLPLKYIHRVVRRYKGRTRIHYYFRRGDKNWPLPGAPGSSEFIAEYNKLLSDAGKPVEHPAATGTMEALIIAWRASSAFKALAPSSADTYGRVADWFIKEHGARLVTDLTPAIIRNLTDKWAAKPAMGNKRLMILKLLMKFAFERDWRPDNPAIAISRIRHRAKGFPAWTDAELAAFEARWPIGTRERLAFELLLMTGQRRSDVIRMGPRDIRDGGIEVHQQKTDTPLWIPIDPLLKAAIEACPITGTGTFLITQYGKPFASPTAFYNWFRDKARAAGVAKSPHGLRKANQRIIAEQGGTTKQAMAVSGHRTMTEAERYSREADQRGLARAGVEALRRGRKADG